MSINFAVYIANVKFQYPRARGDAKVLLAHPTPGSILRGLFQCSFAARVPWNPTSTATRSVVQARGIRFLPSLHAEWSRERLAENREEQPVTARLKVVP